MEMGEERVNRLALPLLDCMKPKITCQVIGIWLEYLSMTSKFFLCDPLSTSRLFRVIEHWWLSQFKTSEALLAVVSSFYGPLIMIWHSSWKVCNSVNLSLQSQLNSVLLIIWLLAILYQGKVTENLLRISYHSCCWVSKPGRSSWLIDMHEKQLLTHMVTIFTNKVNFKKILWLMEFWKSQTAWHASVWMSWLYLCEMATHCDPHRHRYQHQKSTSVCVQNSWSIFILSQWCINI